MQSLAVESASLLTLYQFGPIITQISIYVISRLSNEIIGYIRPVSVFILANKDKDQCLGVSICNRVIEGQHEQQVVIKDLGLLNLKKVPFKTNKMTRCCYLPRLIRTLCLVCVHLVTEDLLISADQTVV